MIRAFGVAVVAMLAYLCAGCTLPQTPAQSVLAATATYNGAGKVALTYMALPRCTDGGPKVCSSPAVVDAIKTADNAAYATLKSAEAVVRTPGFGDDAITSAVAAARGAVDAFVAVTNAVK